MEGGTGITQIGPIFPLATLADLHAELEDTERALARLGQGFIVDREQLAARRTRLEWWRDRIRTQITDTEGRTSE